MIRDLESVLAQARTLSPEALPRLIGDLAEIQAVALARLAAPAAPAPPDERIAVREAAHRLGVSPDYLYRHWKKFPFTRREGRKLLFDTAGLDSYLKKAR